MLPSRINLLEIVQDKGRLLLHRVLEPANEQPLSFLCFAATHHVPRNPSTLRHQISRSSDNCKNRNIVRSSPKRFQSLLPTLSTDSVTITPCTNQKWRSMFPFITPGSIDGRNPPREMQMRALHSTMQRSSTSKNSSFPEGFRITNDSSKLNFFDETSTGQSSKPLLLTKKINRLPKELKLKCTEFDSKGDVKMTAGEISKSKFCEMHGLQSRDLRKIDSNYINQMPALLPRETSILVNLHHIRALIKADSVMLFDTYGSSDTYNQSSFIYELQERLRQGPDNTKPKPAAIGQPRGAESKDAAPTDTSKSGVLSYEFRALETILISVMSTLEKEMDGYTPTITQLLTCLEETIDREKLKELLKWSKTMSEFEQKVSDIRGVIDEVLNEDEDLAAMYLTERAKGRPRSLQDHTEAELLLETYLKQSNEILNTVTILMSQMRTTEDIVNIMLDSQRNYLLLLGLKLNMATVGLSSAAFLTGVLGMNLKNGFEDSNYAFLFASGAAVGLAAAVVLGSLSRLRRVARKS